MPALSGLSPSITFAENAVNAAPAVIDSDVVFTDAEGNFTGGTLTVTGVLSEDRIAIRNQGFGAGEIGIFGSNVTYNGIAIGVFSGGVGGNFTVVFNSAATSAGIDALIQNLTYANVSDTPTAFRALRLNVIDSLGGALGVSGTGLPILVTVNGESDAPTLSGVATSVTFAENAVNAAPALLDADVQFAIGSSPLTGGRLIVSGLLGEDRIGVRDQGSGAGEIGVVGASIRYGGVEIGTLAGGVGTTLVVTFNASATAAAVDALIQNLTYANASNTPTPSHSLHFNVIDSAGQGMDGGFALSGFPGNPLAAIATEINPAPAFVDLDSDGDLDVAMGDLYGVIHSYRNDAGSYVALSGTANPFAAIDVGFVSAPAFVDLDGDGDKDLIVGGDGGVVQTFRNDGGSYVRLTGAEDPFAGVAWGRAIAPSAADVDIDSDIDLVFGRHDGGLRYFRNDGGSYVERTGADNPFAGIAVGSYASPAWIDVDGDGDLDLAVGSWGNPAQPIRTWRNDGGAFSELAGAANPLQAVNTAGLFLTRPVFTDLDGDGDPDVVIATSQDGLFPLRNDASFGPSITVHIVAESDVPSLAGLAGVQTFAENAVNAAPALLDAEVVFDASSAGMAGGALTVAGLLAEDRVAIRSSGPLAVSGNDVSYAGISIGTIAGGNGTPLTVTLTAAATSAALDALIQNLTYANVSDTPAGSRTLTLNVTDSLGVGLAGGSQSITIGVTAENDAPTLGGLAGAATFAENAAPALIDSDVVLTDAEGNLAGGSLTVSGLLAEDRVGIRAEGLGAGQITVFGANLIYDGIAVGTFTGGVGGTLTVSFNSAATTAAVDALIQNLTYANASDTPTAGRTLTVAVTDAAGAPLAQVGQIVISVTAENDLPAETTNLGLTLDEGATTTVTAALLAFADPEQADGAVAFTLTSAATNGTLFRDGVALGLGDGFTQADIAAGLISYTHDGSETTSAGFGFSVSDGAGGSVTAQTFDILVNAIDDAAAANDDSGITTPENAPLIIDLLGNDMDPDSALAVATVVGHAFAAGTTIVLASGAQVTMHLDGTLTYDPGGAFDDLPASGSGASNLSRNDSFSYTVSGGDTAVVTVTVTGVDTDDILLGTAGNDSLDGGIGSNTASYANAASAVNVNLEAAGSPQDTIGAGLDTLANIRNLTGSAFNDKLTGDAAANTFDGGLGADRMKGRAGDDVYLVDNAGDQAVELAGEGSDTVRSTISYSLAGQQVEALVLLGSADLNGQGNSLDNAIAGNAGANTLTGLGGNDRLDGGAGADRLYGGAGDDRYIVGDAGDGAYELAGEGHDTVQSALSYSLGGQFIEDLVLTGGGASNGAGNSLDNAITGNGAANVLVGHGGNDRLDGGAGADQLHGGAGDDVYVVESAGDLAHELDGEGQDRVESSVTYALEGQEVEDLLLTGAAALNGSGNGLGNAITGNAGTNKLSGLAGADTLDGGGGADRLIGGAGDDLYRVDDAGDRAIEIDGEGSDRVESTVSYAIVGQSIEDLTLVGTSNISGTGNSLDNGITGNAGANKLIGGLGNDMLTGGNGADSFYFNTALDGAGNVDTITDFAAGIDKILLDKTIFAGLAKGSLAASAFAIGTEAQDADDRIVYDDGTGALWFDADGNGAGTAIQFATLDTGLSLQASDFTVFL